jgi:anti-anti-sigma factor
MIQFLLDIFKDKSGKLLPSIKEIKRLNGTIIVIFQGVIDSSTVPIIGTEITDEMKEYIDRNIILDFREVTHIDSSTLAYMISLISQLKKQNRRLGLINTQETTLKSYLEIQGVGSGIHIYNNQEEALKDFSNDS